MLFWHILAVCRWYFSFHSRFLSMSIVIICMWDVQFTHFSYKDWKCMTQGRQIHLGPRGELVFWRNIFFSLESWPCSNSFQKVFDWLNVFEFLWIINKRKYVGLDRTPIHHLINQLEPGVDRKKKLLLIEMIICASYLSNTISNYP